MNVELWWADGVIEHRDVDFDDPPGALVTAVHPGQPERGNAFFRRRMPRLTLPRDSEGRPVPIYVEEAREWVS